jgi:hypothetical protein
VLDRRIIAKSLIDPIGTVARDKGFGLLKSECDLLPEGVFGEEP